MLFSAPAAIFALELWTLMDSFSRTTKHDYIYRNHCFGSIAAILKYDVAPSFVSYYIWENQFEIKQKCPAILLMYDLTEWLTTFSVAQYANYNYVQWTNGRERVRNTENAQIGLVKFSGLCPSARVFMCIVVQVRVHACVWCVFWPARAAYGLCVTANIHIRSMQYLHSSSLCFRFFFISITLARLTNCTQSSTFLLV